MLKKKMSMVSLVTGLVGASSVLAQTRAPVAPAAPTQVVGATVEVQGLVTVSDGTSISNVRSNDPVIDRTRYVTSSTGSITLKYREDCEVRLKPNQALTVDGTKNCDELIALIQGVGGGGGFFASGGVLVGLTNLLGIGLVRLPTSAPAPEPIPNPPASGS